MLLKTKQNYTTNFCDYYLMYHHKISYWHPQVILLAPSSSSKVFFQDNKNTIAEQKNKKKKTKMTNVFWVITRLR